MRLRVIREREMEGSVKRTEALLYSIRDFLPEKSEIDRLYVERGKIK